MADMNEMRIAVLALLCAAATAAGADSRPRIRAVTAFTEVASVHYASQIEEAQKFLAGAKDALKRADSRSREGGSPPSPLPSIQRA